MNVALMAMAGLGAALFTALVVVYARRPWWTSHTGRILMTMFVVLSVLLVLRTLNLAMVAVPSWAWLVGYAVLDAGGVGLLWLLLQGEDRSPPKEGL